MTSVENGESRASSDDKASTETANVEVSFIPLPMVLITQIQRSGGTLLSQLFDGHPQICAHPHELHIGRPKKWNWPDLDMRAEPAVWFAALYEKRLEAFYGDGYVKPGSNPYAQKDVHSFSFNPNMQQAVFVEVLRRIPPKTQRDVLNAFFTSFFAAWGDVSVESSAKFVSAFCPRVLMFPDSTERFVRDYPDGHIVSSVRDPRTWYASTRKHNPTLENVREAIPVWMDSTKRIIEMKRSQPNYIYVATYERLVQETEKTMRGIATFIGIDFEASLLSPTYASQPMLPNSSYARPNYGVNTDSIKTATELSGDDLAYIEDAALPLYEDASQLEVA